MGKISNNKRTETAICALLDVLVDKCNSKEEAESIINTTFIDGFLKQVDGEWKEDKRKKYGKAFFKWLKELDVSFIKSEVIKRFDAVSKQKEDERKAAEEAKKAEKAAIAARIKAEKEAEEARIRAEKKAIEDKAYFEAVKNYTHEFKFLLGDEILSDFGLNGHREFKNIEHKKRFLELVGKVRAAKNFKKNRFGMETDREETEQEVIFRIIRDQSSDKNELGLDKVDIDILTERYRAIVGRGEIDPLEK